MSKKAFSCRTPEYSPWERFEGKGSGSLSDKEVCELYYEVNNALVYLRKRHKRYALAYTDALNVESKLMHMIEARKIKVCNNLIRKLLK